MAKPKSLKDHFDNLQYLSKGEHSLDEVLRIAKATAFGVHIKKVKRVLLKNFASRYKDLSPDILDKTFEVIAGQIVNEMKEGK